MTLTNTLSAEDIRIDHSGGRPSRTLLTQGVDGVTDLAVLAFAVWTVLYHLDLILRLGTMQLLALWTLSIVVLAGGYLWLHGRFPKTPVLSGSGVTAAKADKGPIRTVLARLPSSPIWSSAWSPTWMTAAIICGVAAGVTAGLPELGVPWPLTAALGLGAVVLAVVALPGRRGQPMTGAAPARIGPGSVLALLTGVGLAVFSLFTVNPDGDDAYFMSRVLWSAQLGRIPLRDVIFTDQRVGYVAGGAPVSSIEVLNGALARLFGVGGATFLWYVFLPAVTFFAVWALWRLTRQWAPRRAALCFAVAVVYLLWSGLTTGSFGAFHLTRMWQGKTVFVALLVPLLYVYLTMWAERRSPRALVLAVAAGICAVGLTSTAIFLMPLIVAGVVAPLLLAGRVRIGLAAGAVAVYPLAAGLAVAMLHGNTEVSGAFRPAAVTYSLVLLTGAFGVIAGCALWTAPWLARRGAPALIVTGVMAVVTVLLVPGVLESIRDVVPATAVLWRVPWVAPIPVLVGLLAAVPTPGFPRRLAPGPALALGIVLVLTGSPVWSAKVGTTLAAGPSWKADPDFLDMSRRVVRADAAGGTILAPPRIMRNIPLITSRIHAVNPNQHYLENLPASQTFIADRMMLSAMVTGSQGPFPTVMDVKKALSRADVTYACVWGSNKQGMRLLRLAGYGHKKRIDKLRCVTKE